MKNKGIITLFLGLSINIQVFSFTLPFAFEFHECVELTPLDVYAESLTEKDIDKMEKHYCDGIYFECLSYSLYKIFDREDIKKGNVILKFDFTLISKFNNFDYDIKKIQIINGKDIYDMKDILYKIYPCESPLKTEFEKTYRFPNYYVSRYLLGFSKFPAKNKDIITIRVTILAKNKLYEFDYLYKVRKSKRFFYWIL